MRRTISTLRSQLPAILAGSLWAAYAALTVLGVNVGADDEGRLFGMATVCLTFWAIMCHRDRRRAPAPAGRLVTEDELEQVHDAMARAMSQCFSEPPENDGLHSVRLGA